MAITWARKCETFLNIWAEQGDLHVWSPADLAEFEYYGEFLCLGDFYVGKPLERWTELRDFYHRRGEISLRGACM